MADMWTYALFKIYIRIVDIVKYVICTGCLFVYLFIYFGGARGALRCNTLHFSLDGALCGDPGCCGDSGAESGG